MDKEDEQDYEIRYEFSVLKKGERKNEETPWSRGLTRINADQDQF